MCLYNLYVWLFFWYDCALLGRVATWRGSSEYCLLCCGQYSHYQCSGVLEKVSCKIEIHGLVFTDLSVNLFFLQVKDSFYNFCQIASPNSNSKLGVRLETPSSSSSSVIGAFGSWCLCANPLAFSWTVGFLQTIELYNRKCLWLLLLFCKMIFIDEPSFFLMFIFFFIVYEHFKQLSFFLHLFWGFLLTLMYGSYLNE